MLQENVRNIVIEDQDHKFLITDRKILEFLFSSTIKQQIQGGKILDNFSVARLVQDLDPAISNRDLNISECAKLLTSLENPFLLFENGIVTPWDVVMKTIGKGFLVND